jgi:Domain of unknown function DUF29
MTSCAGAPSRRVCLRGQAGGRLNEAPDWENLAEEIESLGLSQRHELSSRIATILEHLLMKLAASPAHEPAPGWVQTVVRERDQIEDLFDKSPSLRRQVPAIIHKRIPVARQLTVLSLQAPGEQPRVDIASLDFDEAAVLTAPLPLA